ncbi:ATP-dependent DNA ligase [Chitinibacter tainanensis]|uniref:ATP-dependent DNA ligase n=1 Tax=Chitinibacter tainanensis TaxID=230667 RepID=UPI00040841B7|nr:hypothetical protein [Chitinibacter tainanensis]
MNERDPLADYVDDLSSADVLTLLNEMKGARNTEIRQTILIHNETPMVQKVMRLAYDPKITFGVKPPKIEPNEAGRHFNESTFELFDRLASRELTGNAAKLAVLNEMQALDTSSAEVFGRILKKDLRCGLTEMTVWEAMPHLYSLFRCQLAHPFEEKRFVVGRRYIVEPKLDGVRVLALVRLKGQSDMSVTFCSREGNEFPAYDFMKDDLAMLVAQFLMDAEANSVFKGGVVIDGEMISGGFNKTVSDARKGTDQAVDSKFCVFDILPLDAFEGADFKNPVCDMTLERRQIFVARLADLARQPSQKAPVLKMPCSKVGSVDEVHRLFEQYLAKGLEGAMLKDIDAPYCKKRVYEWMKLKAENSDEFRVVGAYFGEEGKDFWDTLGGLIVQGKNGVFTDCGGGFKTVPQAGHMTRSEFNDALIRDFAKLGYRYDAEHNRRIQVSLETIEEEMKEREFEVLGRIVECEYHELTPDGAMRHPRFKRFRDNVKHGVQE